jgi:hypothetical protein
MNASPLGYKKNRQNLFLLLTFKLLFANTGFSCIFAGGTWKQWQTFSADFKNQI